MSAGSLKVGRRHTLATLAFWLTLGGLACGGGSERDQGRQAANPDVAILAAQGTEDEALIQAIERIKSADVATLSGVIPNLIALLSDDSPAVARAAESALSVAGTAAVRPLILAYRDEPKRPAVRRVLQLARAESQEIDLLASDMTSQSMTVRLHTVDVAGALARQNGSALQLLVKGLSDTEPAVQLAAMDALADLGPTASPATAELASLLFSASPNVSEQAARALGMIGSGAAAARADLQRASRTREGRVAIAARAALERLDTSTQ